MLGRLKAKRGSGVNSKGQIVPFKPALKGASKRTTEPNYALAPGLGLKSTMVSDLLASAKTSTKGQPPTAKNSLIMS